MTYEVGAEEANILKSNLKYLNSDNNSIQIVDELMLKDICPKFKYDLSGAHTSTINIIRFSPDGMYLASGGDDSAIVIWVQKIRPKEFGSNIEEVLWSNYKILRGHLSDIYDIAWSPDSKYIVSGSVDNSAIVFSVEKGKMIQKFNDHSNFVQGVSWDPRNKFLVSQSSDKSARVYKNAIVKQDIKFYFAHQIKKNSVVRYIELKENVDMDIDDQKFVNNPKVEEKVNNKFTGYMFADELQCSNSFVRRNTWSPDGSICLMVSGK